MFSGMSSENKPSISQKEYLKRYLSSDKDDKKKKKKRLKCVSSSTALKRSKIIDDDVDINSMRVLNDDEIELYQLDEDAPQIAGIIDERPVDVQAMEYYNSKRWKVFGADGDGELTVKDSFEKPKHESLKNNSVLADKDIISRKKLLKENDSDLEPPRKSKGHNIDFDKSPNRHPNPESKIRKSRWKAKSDSDSDLSPPRTTSKKSSTIKSKNHSDSDLSPPRQPSKVTNKRSKHDSDSDLSPVRKQKRQSSNDSDLSPPRRSDQSRQYRESDFSSHGKEKSYSKFSKDLDSSKFRQRCAEDRRDRKDHHGNSSYRKYGDDDFKGRRRKYSSSDSEDTTERRKNRFNNQESKDKDRFHKRDKYDSSLKDSKHKMEKTLDGKQAGLQDSKQLKQELQEFKDREDKMFSKMGTDLSGRGATTIMRDRKTGLKRDLDKERQVAMETAEKATKDNEKYVKWGKGLKQVEEAAERFASATHEMSKPLARYADDTDLDKFLKAQEREGDPMLDYIRSKQKDSIPLTEKKPLYAGTFLPNRFGIRPGYRWDGVDRSNGYEKKWFETQNSRRARDEDAYKWSVSDM